MKSTEPESDFMAADRFAGLLGVRVEKAEAGEALAELPIRPEHFNGHGSVHGAVIFALADIAFAAACNSEVPAIAIQADVRFLARPEGQLLRARAFQLNASRKLASYQVDVSDEGGNPVAKFSGSAYRF